MRNARAQMTVTITTTKGTKDLTGKPIAKYPYFVITPSWGHTDRWALTHVPSGHRIAGDNQIKRLRQLADRLAALPMDWNASEDVIKTFGPIVVPVIQAWRIGS